MWVIWAGIDIMLVKIASREDTDQTTLSETPKTGLLAMLVSWLYYLNLSDRFSCATALLIAGHPSIKYSIQSHLVKMTQSPDRATILHFFLLNAEIKFFTR